MTKWILVFFLIPFLFQNCDKAGFTEVGSLVNSSNNGQDVGQDELDDVKIIADSCANSDIKTKKIKIEFPKPDRTCDWDKNGNLSERNEYFRARIEQIRELDLPKGSIICDADFEFAKQDFLYDDHFMLLFNDSVIASSYNFTSRLDAGNFGLLEYDWNNIRGTEWDFGQEMIFCPEIDGFASSCKFPGHDKQGFIELDFDSFYIKAIMSNGLPENHFFSLVSIGDNDKWDCEHSDMEFTVTVDYVE